MPDGTALDEAPQPLQANCGPEPLSPPPEPAGPSIPGGGSPSSPPFGQCGRSFSSPNAKEKPLPYTAPASSSDTVRNPCGTRSDGTRKYPLASALIVSAVMKRRSP